MASRQVVFSGNTSLIATFSSLLFVQRSLESKATLQVLYMVWQIRASHSSIASKRGNAEGCGTVSLV